jgi:hypothetical protein
MILATNLDQMLQVSETLDSGLPKKRRYYFGNLPCSSVVHHVKKREWLGIQ